MRAVGYHRVFGLKARHGIARAEGPFRPGYHIVPFQGGTSDQRHLILDRHCTTSLHPGMLVKRIAGK